MDYGARAVIHAGEILAGIEQPHMKRAGQIHRQKSAAEITQWRLRIKTRRWAGGAMDAGVGDAAHPPLGLQNVGDDVGQRAVVADAAGQ